MKLFRKMVALLLIVALMLTITACGNQSETEQSNNGDASTNQQSSDSTSNEVNATDEEEPITLKITWWGGQTRHDYTQKLLDKYTELNPNITFEAVPSGWDGYFDKMATQAAAGSMPDIVQMDYLYISTYAENNSLADLQEFVDNGIIDVSNIDPILYESGRIDGKLAGMVLSSALLTYAYNEDVLNEAGITLPTAEWTWEDFININKVVAEKTGKMGFAASLVEDTNNFNYYVRQHGESLFSADKKSLGYANDQIFIDFVNMMSDLMDNNSMPTPDEYETIKSYGVEANPTISGDAATTNSWSNFGVIAGEEATQIKLITPPYGKNNEKALWVKPGMFFSIADTSQVKEEAAKFIDWFINSEEANDIIMAERGVPVSSAVRDYLKDSGNLSNKQIEMFEYVDDAIAHCDVAPAPDPTGISEVNDAFKTAVYSVLYNQATVEEAATTFRSTADEILARNN